MLGGSGKFVRAEQWAQGAGGPGPEALGPPKPEKPRSRNAAVGLTPPQ